MAITIPNGQNAKLMRTPRIRPFRRGGGGGGGPPTNGLIGAYDFARADLIDATGLILNSIAPYAGSGPVLDRVTVNNTYWSEEQGAFITTDVNGGTQLVWAPTAFPNGAFCSVFAVFCCRINPIASGTFGATRVMNGRNGGAIGPRGTFTSFQLLIGGNQSANGIGELEIAGYGFQPNDNSVAWSIASIAGAPVYIEGTRTQSTPTHDQVGIGAASASVYGVSIYEAVFYDRYLSEAEAVQVVEYLQTKYATKVPVAVTPDLPYNGVLNSGTDGAGITGFQSGNTALDPQSLLPAYTVNGAPSATYEFVTLPADVILLEPQQGLEVPFRMSADYGVSQITVTVQGATPVVMNWTGQAYVANSAALRAHMELNVGVDLTINIVQGGPITVQLPIIGPFELPGNPPFYLRKVEPDWEVGYSIDADPEPEVWINLRQALQDANIDINLRNFARQKAIDNGWIE